LCPFSPIKWIAAERFIGVNNLKSEDGSPFPQDNSSPSALSDLNQGKSLSSVGLHSIVIARLSQSGG
jgi:hypothetical protein